MESWSSLRNFWHQPIVLFLSFPSDGSGFQVNANVSFWPKAFERNPPVLVVYNGTNPVVAPLVLFLAWYMKRQEEVWVVGTWDSPWEGPGGQMTCTWISSRLTYVYRVKYKCKHCWLNAVWSEHCPVENTPHTQQKKNEKKEKKKKALNNRSVCSRPNPESPEGCVFTMHHFVSCLWDWQHNCVILSKGSGLPSQFFWRERQKMFAPSHRDVLTRGSPHCKPSIKQ